MQAVFIHALPKKLFFQLFPLSDYEAQNEVFQLATTYQFKIQSAHDLLEIY